jgi:transcription initiation factor TFIIB
MYSSVSCSKCHLDHLVADPQSGEVICSVCGLVIQEKMQETKTQFYDTGADQRGTEPSSLASYDMGLSTIIGKIDKDAKGQIFAPSVYSIIHRLRTWEHRIQLHSSKDRNLKRAFYTLNMLKEKLNLSNVTIEKEKMSSAASAAIDKSPPTRFLKFRLVGLDIDWQAVNLSFKVHVPI